jgi:hypothetical protein
VNNSWRLAKCVGENNLAQAIEDFESNGYEIFQIIFMGLMPVQASKLDIAPPTGQTPVAPIFLLVAKDETGGLTVQ